MLPTRSKKKLKKKNTLPFFFLIFFIFFKPCIRSKYQAFYSKKSTFYLLATMREKHSIMNEPYVSKKVLRVFTYIFMYMKHILKTYPLIQLIIICETNLLCFNHQLTGPPSNEKTL